MVLGRKQTLSALTCGTSDFKRTLTEAKTLWLQMGDCGHSINKRERQVYSSATRHRPASASLSLPRDGQKWSRKYLMQLLF